MRAVLLISIVLNLGLALLVGKGLQQKETALVPTIVAKENKTAEPKADVPERPNLQETPAESRSTKPFHWSEVESADYKTYIENLRRIHCPEPTIAEIIIADVNKYYRARLAPYRKDNDKMFKFWQSDNSSYRRDPAYEKMRFETEKEKNKLLKELLGKSYKEELVKSSGWQMEPTDPFFKNIPEDKKDRMSEIEEKFSEMKSEVYRRSRGYQDDEDRKELKKIEQERTAELAKIFSPEELFEYQLRRSETAQNMKWNELEGLNTTEAEYRAIFKAKMASENPDLLGLDEMSSEERSKFVNEARENLKTTLGEERYKEYTLNKDWDYRNLRKLVEKNGGDKQIALEVFGMKDSIQRAANQVRNDKSLSKEERDQKLLAIREEVDKTLSEALGERGYKAFKRNAWWIQEIARDVQKKQP